MSLSASEIAKACRQASLTLQSASTESKNTAMSRIKSLLAERQQHILSANKLDMENAQKQVAEGKLSSALVKRLDLNGNDGEKFRSLLSGIDDVIALEDPIGKVTLANQLDDGLNLYRVTCPVGVVLIIFEARPEVVVQISCLALKSGNAVILKGGSEALHSNQALYDVIRDALTSLPADSGIHPDAIQLVSTRNEIAELLKQEDYIDLVIPRGSKSLVKHIQSSTRIPVLGHADGICSVYVDADADLEKSVRVVTDSKINYPAACNATETLLIHRNVIKTHLSSIVSNLVSKGVQVRLEESLISSLTAELQNHEKVQKATAEDFDTEFLDLIIAVKSVGSDTEAIAHINSHGSHHTDSIITETKTIAERFMSQVDSAGVYWNASTRFADGFRYGFGAEIGVSTNKTHARGPVGLEGLTIYKYRLYGDGHIVAEYGSGVKQYHRKSIPLDIAQSIIPK